MGCVARAVACVAIALMVATVVADARPRPAPPSIDQLRATHADSSLTYVRALDDGPGFSAYLVSYGSAGLKVYGMVAVPTSPAPPAGFPVLIANHGTHPNPPRYGITASGVDSRPGDYYRSIPALYAQQGFLVVIPDYRGHNVSEGLEFTGGFLASAYYAEDVLALLGALHDLRQADLGNVFMWGHSLGGEVTLRTLLATERVKGASIWSSVGGDIWDQAYFYSRYQQPLTPDGDTVHKGPFDDLSNEIREFGASFDWTAREPLRHLEYLKTPLIIHHSIGDTEASYSWSMRLAAGLYLGHHVYAFYTYSTSDHFLRSPQREQAVARDVEFFRSLMQPVR